MLIKNKVVTNFAAVTAALNAGYTHLTIASATSPLTTPSHGLLPKRYAMPMNMALRLMFSLPLPSLTISTMTVKLKSWKLMFSLCSH